MPTKTSQSAGSSSARHQPPTRRDFERFAETATALFQTAMIKLMTRRIARDRDF
jgi:hypothetical protein